MFSLKLAVSGICLNFSSHCTSFVEVADVYPRNGKTASAAFAVKASKLSRTIDWRIMQSILNSFRCRSAKENLGRSARRPTALRVTVGPVKVSVRLLVY